MMVRLSFTLPEATDLRAFVARFREQGVYWGNYEQFNARLQRVSGKIDAAIDQALEAPRRSPLKGASR